MSASSQFLSIPPRKLELQKTTKPKDTTVEGDPQDDVPSAGNRTQWSHGTEEAGLWDWAERGQGVDLSDNGLIANAARDAAEVNRDTQLPIMKLIPTIEFSLKKHFVPNPTWPVIVSNLGRVNSDSPAILLKAPPETVLYSSFSASQSFLWDGASITVQPWTLDFKMTMRVVQDEASFVGWNHVYSPNHHDWRKVILSTGNSLHSSFNVSGFFHTLLHPTGAFPTT